MALSKSQVFLVLCLTANIGLGFGYKFEYENMVIAAMFFIVLFTIGFNKQRAFLIGGAGLVLVAACFWSAYKLPTEYGMYFGQKKTKFTVIAITDPEVKKNSHSFLARVTEVEGQPSDDRIAVVLPKYPKYEYGAKLELEGELQPASEFNFKDNVSAQTIFPKVISEEMGHGSVLRRSLYKLKAYLLGSISQMLSAPESGLLGGLLLGTRHMPDYLLEQFRTTGTSHIIAVSGFNVTIVATFLDRMLRRFGRSASFYSSILGIAGFVVITGASASVVRAGIMGSLALVAQHFGRLYASINALLLASAAMLFQNPKLLVYDIGFQLSFAALAGLLFIQPLFDSRFPNANIILSSIFPTIAAQITTAPIILYHFGNFSLVSVLANLFVLPGIPIAMLLGFAALLIYIILPSAGAMVASAVWLLLHYMIWIIGVCASIPLASIGEIPFPLYTMLGYFTGLIWFLKWKLKQKTLSNI